jgi:4-amino-4-deoxy-L-arabinose transferase-like glycosyltransferase
VLEGNHALYFPRNHGREPLYIYLTAVAISLFGRSAFAVRLGAAVIGSLTTLVTYKLAKEWFGWRVGLLSAWLWAITLWPVHLSRIGFRPILLPFFLGLTFWLGTLAYKRQDGRLWLLTGLIYSLSFYTYLAVRFTPVLLILLAVYCWITQRRKGAEERLQFPISNLLLFALATAVVLLPLVILTWQNPDLILGRTGQVAIWDEAVNNGRFWSTLWQHTVQALGLFFWQGDTILRHNPAGRPIFDFLMTLPFLIGVIWCVRHWRRWTAMTLLLWTAVMLGPTLLSTDTPHFLRAVGILPAAVIFPALGLAWIWQKLERREWRVVSGEWRVILPPLLSAVWVLAPHRLTIWDYDQ